MKFQYYHMHVKLPLHLITWNDHYNLKKLIFHFYDSQIFLA